MWHSVEKTLWMRLWTYRKTDCGLMVRRNAKVQFVPYLPELLLPADVCYLAVGCAKGSKRLLRRQAYYKTE